MLENRLWPQERGTGVNLVAIALELLGGPQSTYIALNT